MQATALEKIMTNETHFPTATELHAYEVQAHELRAQAMKSGIAAISASFKSAAHRVAGFLTRPAHA